MSAPRAGGRSAPAAPPWVATVELDGEAVLFDERSGTLHHLDQVATIVWARLDGTVTLDALAGELGAAFGADRDRVRADLLTFADQLSAQQLLDERPR